MTLAPSRIGLCFVLALALPATFTATWAALQYGGMIERALADERTTAEQALALAHTALGDELQQVAERCTFPLELGPRGTVTGPFAGNRQADPDQAIGIAEQAAGTHLARGDHAAAMPFFAHAAATRSLSPEGWLRYVELLATDDREAAELALATAISLYPDARCGGLPFQLLALLRRARWCGQTAPGGPERAQQVTQQFLRSAHEMPAAAVAAVLDEFCAVLPDQRGDPRLAELRAAAAAALHFATAPAPTNATPGPDGSVLVPRTDHSLAAIDAAQVARCRDSAFARTQKTHRSLDILVVATSAAAAATGPLLPVPALASTWTTAPNSTPFSTLLRHGARLCLVLAVATFALGNLLVWRLMRRELALVRLRRDFVDVVSHELRTPLAALSLKAEMLAEGDVPAARTQHYLQTLRTDVQRLTDQVERILDFGRLEQGAPLRRETIPARAVLARGLRAGRPSLRLVGQQLEVHAPRQLPHLQGDVEVLSRALRNLLENAAKYAPPGSTVAVRAFADRHRLTVEVADRGPGVPAAERAAIFQPFVRSSTAPPGTPGSGLGLALVAAAAKAHGGRVEVHPREGGGAVFTLTLPVTAEGHAS